MLEVVVLAAGRGTRMRSCLPKVLHTLAGQPLLSHVLKSARQLAPARLHIVVGYGADEVQRAVAAPDVMFHHQREQLGTGHAVLQGLPSCSPEATVLVLFGDVPLIDPEVLKRVVASGQHGPAVLAAKLDDPTGYGRILRASNGDFRAVVEQKDASDDELRVSEVNTGVIAAPAARLKALLHRVGNDNQQGEYYLPDILALAVADGESVSVVTTADALAIQGINDRLQLEALERTYQRRVAEQLMRDGVALRDRHRIDIRGALRCGQDVVIDINTVFEGEVVLDDGATVGANCILKNCHIGAGTVVDAYSYIDGATIAENCRIGPFARIRPGTHLGSGARIGNFVETKNSRFGTGSKANHLAYIGDSDVGDACNIGAGTITCNYDGVNKHRTQLGNDVFVGSNSTLVAPLHLADGCFVGAGSTVTDNADSQTLVIGRARQRAIKGWQRPERKKDT